MTYTTARFIAAAMLVVALGDLPYGYYTLLRFVVCAVAAYGAFRAYELSEDTWLWVLGGTALLFNPIFPVHLGREMWAVVDAATAVMLGVSVYGFRPKRDQTTAKSEF